MLSVLVVDGDQDFLDQFLHSSQNWSDVDVKTARSENEAEEFLRNNSFDMVISEYVLPDRDGIELLRYIRSRYGDLPYLMVTRHGSEAVAIEASRFGISAYIPKTQAPVALFSEIYGKIRMVKGRKDAVDALSEKESRCRAILESQPGFVCRIGPGMVTKYMNRALLIAIGLPERAQKIPGLTEFIVGEDRIRFLAAIEGLIPEYPSCTIRLCLSSQASGVHARLHTEWTFTAAFDENQHYTMIQGAGRDISWEREQDAVRKRQLENLAFLSQTAMNFVDMDESANIFQYIGEKVYSLLPHAVVGVVVYDPATNSERLESVVADEDILAAFHQWFGSDLVGKTFTLDNETFAKVDYLRKGIIEGPPLYFFLLHEFPEESCRRVEEQCNLGKTYVLGFTCHGELFGSIAFILRKGATIENPELLEAFVNQASVALLRWKSRKAAEEEIARIHADLEQKVNERTRNLELANKNLESFSYSVSHDLRAPLRSIEGFSALLLQEYGNSIPPGGTQLIEKTRQNTVKMAELIDAILEFSRTSRRDLRREEVDMTRLVQDVLDEQLAAASGRNVEVEMGDLPPCRADPVLMRQVVQNLISNALKFSRRREASHICLGSFLEGTRCVYYVKDNGVGFDMAYRSHLFKVFERLHDSKDFEGTGIGLAIVENIITRHGGSVWLESDIDKGCTCYFTIGGEG